MNIANSFKIRQEEYQNVPAQLPLLAFIRSILNTKLFLILIKIGYITPRNPSTVSLLHLVWYTKFFTCLVFWASVIISRLSPHRSTPAWTIFQLLQSSQALSYLRALKRTGLSSLDWAPIHSLGLSLNIISLESSSLCPPPPHPSSHTSSSNFYS